MGEIESLVAGVERCYEVALAKQAKADKEPLDPDVLGAEENDRPDPLDLMLGEPDVPSPYQFLGVGAFRIAIKLCDRHVLKIDPRDHITTKNEIEVWNGPGQKDPMLGKLLCPILASGKANGCLWLLEPFCEPAPIGYLGEYLQEQGGLSNLWGLPHGRIEGLDDLYDPSNVGLLDERLVILDYGGVEEMQIDRVRLSRSAELMLNGGRLRNQGEERQRLLEIGEAEKEYQQRLSEGETEESSKSQLGWDVYHINGITEEQISNWVTSKVGQGLLGQEGREL